MSNPSVQENQIHQLSPLKKATLALKKLDAKLNSILYEPIAIIGMGCSFPGGATTPEKYWDLLRTGISTREEIPAQRWDINTYYDQDREAAAKMITRYGYFIKQVDQFDPGFFGISPREASAIDPQHRLLLEVSWQALERAGQKVERLSAEPIGVFVGNDGHDYEQLIKEHLQQEPKSPLAAYIGTGNCISCAAGRLAYTFGFTGPTVTIDTACSSSLVAIHEACNSIRLGECQMAIAGGVKLHLTPGGYIFTSRAGMLSPDGLCKTFDRSADGYGRGEGCGMVVLKRLSKAKADGDPILALIRGSAINQDGPSSSLTVPNGQSQQKLLQKALKQAKVEPAEISYLEAHGTGTSLGDPIEVNAATAVLGQGRRLEHPLWIGTVKTNIGHLEAAAGVSALIKVVLSMQHQQLPAHLHLQEPNPKIDWQPWLQVPQALTPWVVPQNRLAGISSFGFTGTNAHMVLEEAPAVIATPIRDDERPIHLLQLSAKDDLALAELAQSYAGHLEAHPEQNLADICFTANTGRSVHNHRLAVVASNIQDMQNKLHEFGAAAEDSSYIKGQSDNNYGAKVAMLFTGQGSQYVGMARQLYQTQPTFKQAMEQCAEIVKDYIDKPLLEIIYDDQVEENLLDQTAYTQPALFAIEYALYKLWSSWGIKPDVVMGHSVGEYVAACIAGVFSLEDALQLIAHRGKLMQQLPPGGEMVAVMASESKIQQLIAPEQEQLAIAAINGPESTVISGAGAAMGRIREQLAAAGIKTKQLAVSHAFHSPLMEPMLADFEAVAHRITYNSPKIALISNVTGTRADESIATANYWVNHIRQPVQFASSVASLHQEGVEIFLEIGPQPILLGMARQCLPEGVGVYLPSLRENQADWAQMLPSLAELHVRGVKVDWLGFDRDYNRQKVVLPTYPFQRQRYWVETDSNLTQIKQFLSDNKDLHPLLGRRLPVAGLEKQIHFECLLSPTKQTYLEDHGTFDEGAVSRLIFPGAGYLEIALAAGATLFNSEHLILEDVVFQQVLVVPKDEVKTIQIILTPQENQTYSFQIFSLDTEPSALESQWNLHAQGNILAGDQNTQLKTIDLKTIKEDYHQQISVQEIYRKLKELNGYYGSKFQGLQKLWHGEGKTLGQIQLPEILVSEANKYVLHPVLLDSSFQMFIASYIDDQENKDLFLPFHVKRLQVYHSVSNHLWSQLEIKSIKTDTKTLNGDLSLWNTQGMLVAQVEGLTLRPSSGQDLDISNWLYQIQWQPQSTTPQTQSIDLRETGSWLIFGQPTGIGQHLAKSLTNQGQHCILVTPGENFHQLDSQHYQINPIKGDDFACLWEKISQHQHLLRGIIHLWSLPETMALPASVQELQKSQELGCGSVLHLVQAIANNQDVGHPPLWLVTQGAQAVDNDSFPLQFPQGSLWGLGRVIDQEQSELQCHCLDLDPKLEDSLAVPTLLQELLSPGDETLIAYRQQVRYVARLERQQKSKSTNNGLDFSSQQVSIQSGNSYLITGGLGALGLHIGKWMVEQGATHLVLTSRNQPSEKAQEVIQELQKRGAQVLVMCGDISQAEDVAEIIEKINISLPPLRGVIHAAGILDDGLVQQMSWERFTRVMAPKVEGAWHLHNLTEHLPLDFFVCFSSATSVLGSPGQGNYAAANAFMDALAHYRQGIGLPGLSINWGPWAEVGMAASLGSQHQNRMLTQGINPISPEGGLQILANLLGQDSPQVVVLPINWSKFLKQLPTSQKIPFLEAFTSPVGQLKTEKFDFIKQLESSPVTERRELLLVHVREQVARVLGLTTPEKLGLRESLFNLGIDSLMAVELRNYLQSSLGHSIRSTVLFDYPTLEELVDYLGSEVLSINFVGSSDDLESLNENETQSAIAEDLDELSESEAEALLQKELENIEYNN